MEDDSEKGFFGLVKSLIKKRLPIGNSTDLAEEIHGLMDEGQAKGLISNEESHMVHGVLDLKETRADSIMIPRTEMFSAPMNSTLGEITRLVKDCGHTRIPIHNENVDEILGILHAKDLLKLWGEATSSKIPLKILRRPYYVPANQKVSELLRDLKEKKTHLAIVTDEYGGTAGIITIEDILEEIVGEILDEHDNEEPLLMAANNGALLVDARLEIEKLEEHLDVHLPRGDYESVGGFIIHLRGKIPEVDEIFLFEDLEFTVKEADQRKIDKILVTHKSPHGSPREKREADN